LVRFSVNPSPSKGPNERFAAQLALARVHPCLIALERSPGGYAIPRDETRGWFELRPKRGLAGYGLARALRMLLDVLAGLTALEETRTEKGQPFVHGELAPAMIRVDPTGTARLISLAPWHWSAPGTLPVPERHGHLAPERLLGDVIDARADVFSAGTLLWEALAGRRLFETDSVDAIVMRLMGEKVALPELPPELSWAAPLKAVAMCALSVDPEQRFANCAELAEAIKAVAGDRVATHADIAEYFRAPEPAARPSVVARPPALPTHHSSLSALVAPLRQSESAPTQSEVVTSDPSLPARRVSRSVWAIAALSCVVGAIGASAVARFGATLREQHSAASSAPVVGVLLPSAARAATPTPAQPATPAEPATSAVPTTPVPAEPISAAVAHTPAENREKSVKSQRPGNANRLPAKPRSPAKTPRVPNKAAASKYGI
jgi:hypothetical protein